MKVLLTHSEGRLGGLAAALASAGFEVTHLPLIRTEVLPGAQVRPAALDLLEADWLLFTSRTAVSAWAAFSLPLSNIKPKIGVVGEKTRAAIVRLGGDVALTAQPENAKGLLETFLSQIAPPSSVGLPCGEETLPTLPDGLVAAGFNVRRVPLYRTVPQPLEHIAADIVVLASPSAVSALPEVLSPATRFVALGPSTHSALEERGLSALESQTPDVRSVVQAVLEATPRAVELETL